MAENRQHPGGNSAHPLSAPAGKDPESPSAARHPSVSASSAPKQASSLHAGADQANTASCPNSRPSARASSSLRPTIATLTSVCRPSGSPPTAGHHASPRPRSSPSSR
ncbi:hypothetical protein SHJG_5226 [Streptomyces hygroscopicus subsp. jinggangensis 5008]|nr:hypothetical protein SHJG_5226 [Streptomyces hygroscopicus subsp. jinggangensis 5008]AGF64653.1 hypothetical protein SHJGH_4990 [Streptomyces hygroscopicus subsp. jinggangensis TL01]